MVLDPAVLRSRVGNFSGTQPYRSPRSPEERPALVDLLEAQVEHLVFLGLLLGDPPAEVDVDQVDAVLLEPLPKGREDPFDQLVPLRVHVAERGGDEHADGLPGRMPYLGARSRPVGNANGRHCPADSGSKQEGDVR